MAKSKTAPKSYFTHVKSVLEHWQEPTWLGESSPLATPYFLGAQLHGTETTPVARGLVLQTEVTRALETLWRGPLPTDAAALMAAVDAEETETGRSNRYDCLVLELNYLKRIFRPAPKSQAEIYHEILHISRPTHDRHLAQAVERLGTILLQRLRPALRPEEPQVAAVLMGREEQQAQILADLLAGKSVSLIGPGGVGKTSLGAALGESWRAPALFWFTFRATFNDHIDSLLFALGHFLHTKGASTLWHQLIADGGRLQDGNLALGLIRTDLAALDQPPLLCFDELDVLRPSVSDHPNPRHVQLLELLDSLCGHAPLLLVGQRAYWESDTVYTLTGLSATEVDALLTAFAIPHSKEDVARLHYYSGGNPRIVSLCAALYDSNQAEPFQSIIDQLPQSPTLLPFWHRLTRRLSQNERRLLQQLSVFRSAAPVDLWQENEEERNAIQQLLQRRLLVEDQGGGITLLPALREVIIDDLPVEEREHYHLIAAQSRAERGDYTPAAWHLVQAGQPEAAVALWYPQRRVEINRGQAGAALAIFEQISQRRLEKRRARELALLRGELYELAGEPEKIVHSLAQQAWPEDDARSIDAQILWANALRQQGQSDGALAKYAEGLARQRQLLERATQLHTLRSRTYLQQRDMVQARREVELARIQVESLQGAFYDYSGNYEQAQAHYEQALTIAQALDDAEAVAYIEHHLGLLTGRRHGLAVAAPHYEAAMTHYQTIGNQHRVQVVRSNLANTQIQSREFSAAVTTARTALRFFQTIGDTTRIAQNASNLAEALAELDQLAEAESYAQLVLEQEEPQSHPYALYTLGTIRRKMQNLTEAALYYDQARQVAVMNEDNFLLAYALAALAHIYWEQEEHQRAMHTVEQAIKYFTQLGMDDQLPPLHELAATISAAKRTNAV
ncbi:MAG TPA: hypothetical protein P5121_24355 [Caldilineaceae bacterium]|nr:hypothetical protein [Caldilineaceae bacterium]